MAFKLIYLTGTPASGKSTLCRELRKLDPTIDIYEYGSEMSFFLKADPNSINTNDTNDLKQSTEEVSEYHIDRVNKQMTDYCSHQRLISHVIIDSRHVTNEQYGFRVSAFSIEKLRELRLSEIWVLWAPPEATVERIEQERKRDPSSKRPELTIWQAQLQTITLASLASNYGSLAGIPVYLFDSSLGIDAITKKTFERLID